LGIPPEVTESGDRTGRELTVVMPVYNEQDAIGPVLADWAGQLGDLGIDYEIRVYDDGSTDGTGQAIQTAAQANPRILPQSHANRGHGPTIHRGYSEAQGEWVFQTDSDDEMKPVSFVVLWNARHDGDFLIGYRHNRVSPLPRKIIALVSRATVWCLFGLGVRDVNSPYRLIRRDHLQKMLPKIPPRTFAPNVSMSGLAIRAKLRILQFPVPHETRKTGTVSIMKWKLWKVAFQSFRETVAIAFGRAG
jgi:dolichol-phosphate mannosyltransferase